MSPDLIFTAGSLVFIVGLLPACLNPETKMPRRTSVPTAVVLFVYAATFIAMGLLFSAAASTVTASLWTYLALEKNS